ncbi:MAG TPA: acyl-CoA synthetase [Solirubrobacteraceae bacterium]|jgi:fatty-acyl-CoA synthase
MADPRVRSVLEHGRRIATRASDEAYFVGACFRAGIFGLEPPGRLAQMAMLLERYGLLSASLGISALRHADSVVIRDELGDVTYRELDEQTNALANAWHRQGVRAGEGIAILVRNHRGFMQAVFGAAKLGAKIILLNTSFAGPQIREVALREGTDMLIVDDEYVPMLEGIEPPRGRWRAWVDDPSERQAPDTLASLIAGGSRARPPRSERGPRVVILTSGTTGTPKGAPRDEPRSLGIIGGILSKVPLRAQETTVLAAPMFHTLGLAGMLLALSLGHTIVVQRRFDPEQTLDALADNDASTMIVVPVMLQRMMELGEDQVRARDLRALRIILSSGSAISADLVRRGMSAFGPVIYNMYGSTEVAEATIATPEDLAADPTTVGSAVRGTILRILDEHGREVPPGTTGRIFVGNAAQFEGYTGGGDKERIDGLMSSGDLGHRDANGRLYIDGRDDEMIVSGGENVFPAEIENLLAGHEAIADVAAIGVEDEQFGQRLKAFVVIRDGHELSEQTVKEYVRENLARYKVPREVVFLAELPRNPTGKILKRELAR